MRARAKAEESRNCDVNLTQGSTVVPRLAWAWGLQALSDQRRLTATAPASFPAPPGMHIHARSTTSVSVQLLRPSRLKYNSKRARTGVRQVEWAIRPRKPESRRRRVGCERASDMQQAARLLGRRCSSPAAFTSGSCRPSANTGRRPSSRRSVAAMASTKVAPADLLVVCKKAAQLGAEVRGDWAGYWSAPCGPGPPGGEEWGVAAVEARFGNACMLNIHGGGGTFPPAAISEESTIPTLPLHMSGVAWCVCTGDVGRTLLLHPARVQSVHFPTSPHKCTPRMRVRW